MTCSVAYLVGTEAADLGQASPAAMRYRSMCFAAEATSAPATSASATSPKVGALSNCGSADLGHRPG